MAGSFGDIGTDLPLLLGIILASGLDAGGVFIVFGCLQILTGFLYGLPMPMQPLKAMAVLVISQKITGSVLLGGGLAIGLMMMFLTLSGGLQILARSIPTCVVRGIQFGLGLSLASLALKTYIPSMGMPGYALACVSGFLVIALWGNRRMPAGLFVIGLGALFAFCTDLDFKIIGQGAGFHLPSPQLPTLDDVWLGFLLLALPQLPLSLSNSLIATEQTVADLFPERRVSIQKLGLTYSAVNLMAPLVGGIPVCHGCGGLAGHYAFGARTGGSVILYGSFYLSVGLFFSEALQEVIKLFPLPILGVVLLFEALTLLALIKDQAASPRRLKIALLVGVVAFTTPQGFLVGLVLGCLVYYAFQAFGVEQELRQTASH